ncbi:unnamed protein product [Bursaphelenchus xylophilus]|uniref:(pine wood nematode) hypothetical protein n=1 Tax=Bursaphelenchus xylophilus TaxID=6326 RepID=A0A1I7S9U9_BURXY|nr:unnamed protein product [Bursaphelenchus xylophilus]CAG9129255.1 unnamed protein product [Bursaphelenchus xylophilus]
MSDPHRLPVVDYNGDQIYYQPPQQQHQYQQEELSFPQDLLEPQPVISQQEYNYSDDYQNGQGYEMSEFVTVDQNRQMDDPQWNQQYFYSGEIPYTGAEEIVGTEYQSYEPTLAQHNISMNPFEEEDDDGYDPQQSLPSYSMNEPARMMLDENDFEMEADEPELERRVAAPHQQVVVTRRDQRDVEAEIKKRRAAKRAQRVSNEGRGQQLYLTADDSAISQKAREQAAQRFATKEGWECMNKWLKQAVEKDDRERLVQHLETLKFTDVSVDLLQQTDTAKMVRELWKKHSNKKVNELASFLFTSWKDKVATEHKKTKSAKQTKETKEKAAKKTVKQSPPKKLSKEEEKHQPTDVDILGKLIDATDKEASGEKPPSPQETSKNKVRIKPKVKMNKSRLTGLEEDAPKPASTPSKKDKPKPKPKVYVASEDFLAALDAVGPAPAPKKKPKVTVVTPIRPSLQKSAELERSFDEGKGQEKEVELSEEVIQKLVQSKRAKPGILRTDPLNAEEKSWRKIRFRAELVETRHFECDASERVNVSKLSPNEMKHMDAQQEHDALARLKHESSLPPLPGLPGEEPDGSGFGRWTGPKQEFGPSGPSTSWRNLPGFQYKVVKIAGMPLFPRGTDSTLAVMEKIREQSSMAAFFGPKIPTPIANENDDDDLVVKATEAEFRFEKDPGSLVIYVTRSGDKRKGEESQPQPQHMPSPINTASAALRLPLPFTTTANLPQVPAEVKSEEPENLEARRNSASGAGNINVPQLPGLRVSATILAPETAPSPAVTSPAQSSTQNPVALSADVLSILESVKRTEVPKEVSLDDSLKDIINSIKPDPDVPSQDEDLRKQDEDLRGDFDMREEDQDLRGREQAKEKEVSTPTSGMLPVIRSPVTTTSAFPFSSPQAIFSPSSSSSQPAMPPRTAAFGNQPVMPIPSQEKKPVVTTDTLKVLADLAGKTANVVGGLDLAAILSKVDSAAKKSQAAPVIQQLNDPTQQMYQPPPVIQQIDSYTAPFQPGFSTPTQPAFGARPPFPNQPNFSGARGQSAFFGNQSNNTRPAFGNRPIRGPVPCKFFMQGNCNFGEACRNLHAQQPTEGLRRLQTQATTTQGPQTATTTFTPPQNQFGNEFNQPFEEKDGQTQPYFGGRGRGRGRGAPGRWEDRRQRRYSPQRRYERRDERDRDYDRDDRRQRRRRRSGSQSPSRSPPARRRRYRSSSRSRSRSRSRSPSARRGRSRRYDRNSRSRSPSPLVDTARERTPSPPKAPDSQE